MPSGSPHGAFCCAGCRAVHELLRAGGLLRFYELGGGTGRPVGAAPRPVGVHERLEPVLARAEARDGIVRVTVDVQGIHCAACVWLLQELWKREPGALRIDLNPSLGRAELCWREGSEPLLGWSEALERLGYRCGVPGKADRRAERGLLMRTGACVALAMNAMMFAAAGYFGLDASDGVLHGLFGWLSLALAAAAVAIGGPVFFRSAWRGLRSRVLHLDLPIAAGIALAFGGSLATFVTGAGDPYFDTVTVFVALMLVGRYLQRIAVRRNRDYLLANDGSEHLRVRRFAGDRVERVPVRTVRAGDRVLLAPGDLVPADVRLEAEPAAFSLDWITGESRPRTFEVLETVPAGAFLQERRPVVATVVTSPADSEVLRLLAAPERGAGGRGGDAFWRLLNRGYVAAVLGLALSAGAVWLAIDATRVVGVVTAVLVVTCPCALGLAIPLAFDLALARLRRAGVFVRDTGLLERLRRVRHVVFDKTGTLTFSGVLARPVREVPAELRDVLWTMATASNHPVARGVAEAVRGGRFVPELRIEERVGRGIVAHLGTDEFRLGSEPFALGDAPAPHDSGLCVFTRNGHVEACFSLSEDVRPGAREELAVLRRRGLSTWLVSGDREERVDRVATELSLEETRVRAGCRPEEKAALVHALGADATLMIGDGLNDAPAFDAASCAGTPALDRPVMPARSDFFYTGIGTRAVSALFAVADRFRRVVRNNLLLAAGYNSIAVPLAAAGLVSPVLCAVVMPLSSLVALGYTTIALRGGRP